MHVIDDMASPIRMEVLFALIAFLCLGLTDFFRKKGAAAGANSFSYLLVETVVLLTLLPIVAVVYSGKLTLSFSGAIPYALLSGVTITVALVAMLTGLSIGEGSLVIPISRLGLALATLLSLFFLNESITLTKVLGIGLAVAAVFLLSR
ncbi:MAG: EamA family transporter [Candidatus Caldarchaeum sp.]